MAISQFAPKPRLLAEWTLVIGWRQGKYKHIDGAKAIDPQR